jgi:hypothetical protein
MFLRALESMFELRASARKLMTIPARDGGDGTLGPCFRYIDGRAADAVPGR